MLVCELAQLSAGSICWPDEEKAAYRAMGWYGGPGRTVLCRGCANDTLYSSHVSALRSIVTATSQCRDVIGLGSASAAFRRPQFRQASTVIAKPAFRSTARSGNIVPRHLSHLCIDGL